MVEKYAKVKCAKYLLLRQPNNIYIHVAYLICFIVNVSNDMSAVTVLLSYMLMSYACTVLGIICKMQHQEYFKNLQNFEKESNSTQTEIVQSKSAKWCFHHIF